MSNLINLQRDMFHVKVPSEQSALVYSNETVLGQNSLNAKSDGVVYTDIGYAKSFDQQAVTAGNWVSMGVVMQPPILEATPYRIKAYCNEGAAVVIGYVVSAFTGNNDAVSDIMVFPLNGGVFDDIVLITPEPVGGADDDKPIYFGIAQGELSSQAGTLASISVQRMSVAPPQYSSSVS